MAQRFGFSPLNGIDARQPVQQPARAAPLQPLQPPYAVHSPIQQPARAAPLQPPYAVHSPIQQPARVVPPQPVQSPRANPVSNGRSGILPLETILRLCPFPSQMPPMETVNRPDYCFLIKPFQYNPGQPMIPLPLQERYVDTVDADHVIMPCSPSLKYADGKPVWQVVRLALHELAKMCSANKATFRDLKQAIETCAGTVLNTDCLEEVIMRVLTPKERSEFFTTTLFYICNLAMNVDNICSKSPRLLRAGRHDSVVISQFQAASLLACAFFCLYRHRTTSASARGKFQDPNFATLYQRGPPNKLGKIQCILNYFRRVATYSPRGVITIKRFGLPSTHIPDWSRSTEPLVPIHVTAAKKIEEINYTLQVDFANAFIGGGVLGNGCVQEEIRFVICPEMLVSLILCEVMQPNEAILLIGCEQYSSYVGYASSFQFGGDFIDGTERDSWGRRMSRVVAIDALFYQNPNEQYQQKFLDREILKAFVGFYPDNTSAEFSLPVTTGHWGCGAFNGDRQFKAIIQLIATSLARRPMIFAAYLDRNFVPQFSQVYEYFLQQQMTVKDLYNYLRAYCHSRTKMPLFQFILQNPRSSFHA